MFDIGASELLLIVIVAIVVIGPKDMPLALRAAGRWMGKIRRVSAHFRSGFETMIREAELEEMERKWREQNEAIMKASAELGPAAASAEAGVTGQAPELSASAATSIDAQAGADVKRQEPQLPLPPP